MKLFCVLCHETQTRRAERRYELTDGQHPPTARPGPPGPQSPTQQLSRLEWVCHQTGTDRVYINHREHYVWQTAWAQSTSHLAVLHSVWATRRLHLIHWAISPEEETAGAALEGNVSLCKQFLHIFITRYFTLLHVICSTCAYCFLAEWDEKINTTLVSVNQTLSCSLASHKDWKQWETASPALSKGNKISLLASLKPGVSGGCLATSQWWQDSWKLLCPSKKQSSTYSPHETINSPFTIQFMSK